MENLLTKARGHVSLHPEAKARAREDLRARIQERRTMVEKEIHNDYRWGSTLFSYQIMARRRVLAGALIVFVLLGFTVSSAAAQALPGDTLYVVKTRLNEPLRLALTFDEYSQATLEAVFAVRRLNEMATLAERGELTGQTRSELESAFLRHAESARERTASLAASAGAPEPTLLAADLHANLEVALDVHERVLSAVTASDDISEETRAEVSVAIAAVREQRNESAQARVRAEATIATQPEPVASNLVATKLRILENSLTRAGATIKSEISLDSSNDFSNPSASPVTTADEGAMAKIKVASELAREAQTKLEDGEIREAYGLAQSASRIEVEVRLFAEEIRRRPHLAESTEHEGREVPAAAVTQGLAPVGTTTGTMATPRKPESLDKKEASEKNDTQATSINESE